MERSHETPTHSEGKKKEHVQLSGEQILERSAYNILWDLKMQILDMHDRGERILLNTNPEDEFFYDFRSLTMSIEKTKSGNYDLFLENGSERFYLSYDVLFKLLNNSGENLKTLHAHADNMFAKQHPELSCYEKAMSTNNRMELSYGEKIMSMSENGCDDYINMLTPDPL